MAIRFDRLQYLRKELRLTQKELADIVERTPGNVSKWERGEVELDQEMVERLAKIFDTTPEFLRGTAHVMHDVNKMKFHPDEALLRRDWKLEEEYIRKYLRLSSKSKEIVRGTIMAAYTTDMNSGELKSDSVKCFDIDFVVE